MAREIQHRLENVARLEFESGWDSDGEPAVWIWIVIDVDAPAETWTWDNRQSMRSIVTDGLEKAGVTDWAYVRFQRADDEPASTSASST